MIGDTLGHFRITDRLGEGGMGEVYAAEDEKLGRRVAVKVLPEAFGADPERVERFEREARLLATLNHPGIAGIHEFGREGPTHYLVMELAEGETLAHRLEQGRLPLEEAISIALQIASGLEAAHDSGVLHRDLKPANVMVDARDRVKILDFGLAKAMSGEAPANDLSLSPTLTARATMAGQLLGTAAYMSPEQAKGRPADRRSDLWAFGVVLWEMVTGKRLFEGETVSETLAEVLKTEPPWNELPELPPALHRLLRRCLERDPEHRLRDAGDARLELLEARDLEESAVPETGPPAVAPARTVFVAVVAAAVALLLGLLLGRTAVDPGDDEAPPGAGATVRDMLQLTDLPGHQRSPALSADGSQLLYVDTEGGDDDIFLLRVGGEKAVNLTADSPVDDFEPAFSPDGSSIAFASMRDGGGIFRMGATGESPRRLVSRGFDPEYSPDGRLILYSGERVINPYSRSNFVPLRVVGVDGSGDRVLVDFDAVGGTWSPSGRRVAFWSHELPVGGQRDVWTVAAEGGDPMPVTEDVPADWNPLWSADGRWLYFLSDRGGSPDLWRVPIDEATGTVLGDPLPVTFGVARMEEAAMADDGRRIALVSTRRLGEVRVLTLDTEAERILGEPRTLFESSSQSQQADLSPDGRLLATRSSAPRESIFLLPVEGGARRVLVDDDHRNRGPAWSPDGRWVVFYSNRSGAYELWAVRPDGSDLRQVTKVPGLGPTNPVFLRGTGDLCFQIEQDGVLSAACLELGPEGLDDLGAPAGRERLSFLEGSRGFLPQASSPNGPLLAGAFITDIGDLPAVYSLEDATLRRIPSRDGVPLAHGGPDLEIAWLDEHRLLFWNMLRATAAVWDLRTDEIRPVPGIPGPGSLLLGPDRRTLYVEGQPVESDVWLIELGDS